MGKGIIGAGVVMALVSLLFVASCQTIPAGYVGVQKTFGEVHDEPLAPGLHFIKPFIDRVATIETRLKAFEIETKASSKDLQIVTTLVSVQHSLNSGSAPAAYQAIGDLEQFDAAVVTPAVMESTKAVTARYTAEELITHRDVVKQETVSAIQDFIDQTLDDKKIPGAVHISNVSIKDFQFSPEFNNSIEAKVKAQQDALKAQQEKLMRVTNAEAKAREVELAADAEAYQVEQISVQRAAAIEREAQALEKNPLVLQLRQIEKWNGSVPQVSTGSQVLPILNLPMSK